MIDSHCHLDLDAFADDVEQVLTESRQAGVKQFLVPGTTPTGWLRQEQLAREHSDVDIAYGLHPYFLSQHETADATQLRALEARLSEPVSSLVAVGETGLDGVIDVPIARQQRVLDTHLRLAKDADLPVILHHRKTHHLLLKAFKDTGYDRGGVIHAFSGNVQVARSYIDSGFLLGIGGTVTYPRGSKTREAIKEVGLEHIILETDAPDMPMSGRQGKRNSPAFLRDVVEALVTLYDVTEATIITQTSDNYYRQFSRRR